MLLLCSLLILFSIRGHYGVTNTLFFIICRSMQIKHCNTLSVWNQLNHFLCCCVGLPAIRLYLQKFAGTHTYYISNRCLLYYRHNFTFHYISNTLHYFACSKCGRLLLMDKSLALLLPPVQRPYHHQTSSVGSDPQDAYHIGCSSYDA
jgi:hypothetical protein